MRALDCDGLIAQAGPAAAVLGRQADVPERGRRTTLHPETRQPARHGISCSLERMLDVPYAALRDSDHSTWETLREPALSCAHGDRLQHRRRHPRLDPRRDRGHSAGPARPARRGPAAAAGGQDRGAQSRGLDQGPRRRRPDRSGGARRQAPPGGHHHRAHERQHRRRAGDGRLAQGLPRDRGDARQDVEGEDRPPYAPTAPRSWSPPPRSPRLPRVLLPRRRSADRRRSPARSSPTSTEIRPTPRPTTAPPAPSCGGSRAGA